MCLIIDICALSSVFVVDSSDHKEFRPVMKWVVSGRGKVIYGGTKYKQELTKAKKYIKFFGQLKRAGKIVELSAVDVDKVQKTLERKISHRDFDDPHLVAMVIVSKCRLICTNDNRAIPFLKNSKLYPKHFPAPKIYKSAKNATLLRDDYIVEVCKPAKKGTKDLRLSFSR